MFALLVVLGVSLAIGSVGCARLPVPRINPDGLETVPNPLPVPIMDRWLVMDQISDELDDYFRIYREERIRIVDSILTEGWIETHPKIGATLLEPWHEDSTIGFERLHASLQTVRRFAKVRVIPTAENYLIDVRVFKELEDLPNPEQATVSSRPVRHDNSLDIDFEVPEYGLSRPRTEVDGWIPMGRDISLEQQILRNIHARMKCIMETPGPPR